MAPAKGFRRIDSGRGHRYTDDGRPVPGATTILGKTVPKHFEWMAGERVAAYAHDHPEHFAALDPSRLREEAGKIWNDTGARDRGTDVHAIVERLNMGERVDVRDDLADIADAYLAFMRDWRVGPSSIMYAEAPILNRTHNYAGTLDLVAILDGGPLALLDVKTGRAVYPDVALQLAAYRYAEFVSPATGRLEPMPRVDFAAVVHLSDTGYRLVPVDTGPDVFDAFRHCLALAEHHDRADELIGDPYEPPREGAA